MLGPGSSCRHDDPEAHVCDVYGVHIVNDGQLHVIFPSRRAPQIVLSQFKLLALALDEFLALGILNLVFPQARSFFGAGELLSHLVLHELPQPPENTGLTRLRIQIFRAVLEFPDPVSL